MSTTIAKQETAVTRRKATYEEYLNLPDAARITEWKNQEIMIHMPPTYEHQTLSGFLHQLIQAFLHIFSVGEVIAAPFEVKLWPDGPSREPDILFVGNDHLSILTEKRVTGAPDLIIEIISPGTAKIDRVEKFLEYQQAGVREYWIVDPRHHRQQTDFYLLGDDGYTDAAVDENGNYHSTALPGFWLHLDWLWQEPLPNPQVALAEIIMTTENVPPALRQAYQQLHDAFTDVGSENA